MKLGTVLTIAALSGLGLAQPAAAATRSADSLPSVGTAKSGVQSRTASKVRKSEKQTEMTSAEAILLYGSIAAAVIAGVIIISDDNNNNIPDSP